MVPRIIKNRSVCCKNISSRNNRKIFFSLLTIALLTFTTAGHAQVFETESGHVEFKSSVPLHSFTGESDHLVGRINLADSTVDFYVDLHTLNTGIERRDEDMLETLEAKKYPFAEFYGKLVSGFNPDSAGTQDVTVRGDFTVHGVTNTLTVEGTMKKGSKGLHIQASWTLDMSDYNIKPPGILFYRVSEKIPISINATLASK